MILQTRFSNTVLTECPEKAFFFCSTYKNSGYNEDKCIKMSGNDRKSI